MHIRKSVYIIPVLFFALIFLFSCTIVKDGNGGVDSTTQYTLTLSVGNGVTGSPVRGTFNYDSGTTINYNYSLVDSSYSNLQVTLNGTPVAAAGSIVMNGNYSLNASADVPTASYDIRGAWKGTATDSNGDPDPFEITFSGTELTGTTSGYVNNPTNIATGTYSVSGS